MRPEAWCASALARTETLQAMHAVAVTQGQHDVLWSALRADWERFHVVPVDDRCLARAVDIGATFRVSISDRPVELQSVRNERARA